MFIPARLRLVIGVVTSSIAALAMLGLVGCSTGPTAKQNRAGQDITNSPLNHVTLTDDKGTSTYDVGTSTHYIDLTPNKIHSEASGIIDHTFAISNGDLRVTLNSGTNINAAGFEYDPKTGTVKLTGLTTSASEPMTALGDAQAKYQDTIKALSADKRAVLQSGLDTIKGVAPDLFALIAKAIGIP